MIQLLFSLLTRLVSLSGPAMKENAEIRHSPFAAKGGPELLLDSNVVIGQGKQFLASGQKRR
jgi:hypothetical protein